MHAIDVFFIDVILPLSLERNFTYAITKAEVDFIKKGVRVAVPFGRRNLRAPFFYEKLYKKKKIYEKLYKKKSAAKNYIISKEPQ